MVGRRLRKGKAREKERNAEEISDPIGKGKEKDTTMKKKQQQLTGKNLTMAKGAAKENREKKQRKRKKQRKTLEPERGLERRKRKGISASSANRIGKECRSR